MTSDLKDVALRHTAGTFCSLAAVIRTTGVKKTDRTFRGARQQVASTIQKISDACGIEVVFKNLFTRTRITRADLLASKTHVTDKGCQRDRVLFDHMVTCCNSLVELVTVAGIQPSDEACGYYRRETESAMRLLCEDCGIQATFSTQYPEPEPLTADDLHEIGFLPGRRKRRSQKPDNEASFRR